MSSEKSKLSDEDIPVRRMKCSEAEERRIAPADMEPVELKFDRYIVHSELGGMAVVRAGEKTIALSLDSIECTQLVYIRSGAWESPHLPNVYSDYVNSMKEMRVTLESATITRRRGDMLYAELAFKDHKYREFFNAATAGNALIYARMFNAKMYILSGVLAGMSDFAADMLEEQDDEDDYEG
jgi:hypothetical protein